MALLALIVAVLVSLGMNTHGAVLSALRFVLLMVVITCVALLLWTFPAVRNQLAQLLRRIDTKRRKKWRTDSYQATRRNVRLSLSAPKGLDRPMDLSVSCTVKTPTQICRSEDARLPPVLGPAALGFPDDFDPTQSLPLARGPYLAIWSIEGTVMGRTRFRIDERGTLVLSRRSRLAARVGSLVRTSVLGLDGAAGQIHRST